MIVVADTSALIAAYDADDPDSDGCERVLKDAALLIVSPLVLAEVDHVGTRVLGREGARTMIADLRRAAHIMRAAFPEVTAGMLDLADGVRERHAALDLDLPDAVNVVLAAEYRTDAIATLDRRDFRVIRPLTHHKAFRLLPDDL
ncbi:PIN domain-containing protein [Streptomyces beijiangensis]|uniref:Ribonuclease VapC n=1 Tax=Streptomyces beijiangensis TaxID=163361 RepID=A0A939JJL2_9ACTN|nr:PIN domain-containing protein [Streptomyces beijiangensis]MBO0514877.1 PIN domain-containing protein [Streptomyces beijiangensis]